MAYPEKSQESYRNREVEMDFRTILESAVCAPSGDNCQPWRFEIRGNKIDIFNVPEKDTSLFNYKQRASLVAHGALLENLSIAASSCGFAAETVIFPDKANPDLIATVSLRETETKEEPLYPCISQRCTNRKIYDSTLLSEEQKAGLLNAAKESGLGALRLLEGEQKAALAEIICLNDRLVFENPNLHAFLFDHVRWNDHEAEETRDGLDIKTLELAPPDAFAFRFLKHWQLMNFLNTFGVSHIVSKTAKKLAMSASALGVITVSGSSAEDYLSGGRVMERVWLEATRLGLSFQLMTGITCLIGKILDGNTSGLTSVQVKLVKEAYEKITSICRVKEETLVVIFRVGHSAPPSARSLRLRVEKVMKSC